MFSLRAENARGEQITLTHNPAYVVQSIEGLDPPDAVLNLYKQAGADGMVYNSATLDNRQLIITLAVNGPAEDNRRALYRCFQTKKPVRIYYSNSSIDVYADGYVQNVTVDFFGQKQIAQITVICNDPYFHLTAPSVAYFNPTEYALFEFPFSAPAAGLEFSRVNSNNIAQIINQGNIDTGVIIRLMASGAVTNPKIFLNEADAFFGLTTSMQAGDIITIDTRKYHKAVILRRGSAETSLITSRTTGSTWLEAVPGNNTFTFSASSGIDSLTAEIEIIGDIEGV